MLKMGCAEVEVGVEDARHHMARIASRAGTRQLQFSHLFTGGGCVGGLLCARAC
jgi:hypothetical protein